MILIGVQLRKRRKNPLRSLQQEKATAQIVRKTRKNAWNLDSNPKIWKLNSTKRWEYWPDNWGKTSILTKSLMMKILGKDDSRKSKNSSQESENSKTSSKIMEWMSPIWVVLLRWPTKPVLRWVQPELRQWWPKIRENNWTIWKFRSMH